MKYIIKTFNDLTPKEIHQLYKARIDVFVVEQNCPYPDVDMHDLVSIHILLLWHNLFKKTYETVDIIYSIERKIHILRVVSKQRSAETHFAFLRFFVSVI